MAISGLRRRISGSQAARAGVCFAALIVVAEGAVLLLAPSEEGIPPETVVAGDYFDPAEIERATDFREGQRLLLVGGLAAQALVIGALAIGRPRGARDLLARLSSRSVLGTAAAGVLVVVVAEAAALPMTLAAHERSVDVGLSTQTLGPWLGDQAKGLVIGAIVAAGRRRRALRADSPVAALVVGTGLDRGGRIRRRDEPSGSDPDRATVQRLRQASTGK